MNYIRSRAYDTPELQKKIMGPNPVKLEEELLSNHRIPKQAVVCDLGSGQGLTSVFLAKEYGFTVYAADLWSEPEENCRFFREMGLSNEQIIPVKADAMHLPFEPDFFDAVISTDSYNYFGRDPKYLDEKLLPFVKSGGYIYLAIPGMKTDCHDDLPPELLAVMDVGTAGLSARCIVLESHCQPKSRCKTLRDSRDGIQRRSVGRLAQARK